RPGRGPRRARRRARLREPLLSAPARASRLALQPLRHDPWPDARRGGGEAAGDRRAARPGLANVRHPLFHAHPEKDRAAPCRRRLSPMFRLTQYMQELVQPSPVRRRAGTAKPVVIWNLTRRCNLRCRHCYTTSADVHFPGELSHAQAMGVLDDLKAFGIPALILSGGEPLSRFDFFDLAERARDLGLRHLSRSTNGTKLADCADRIADLGFDYVGISLDGIGSVNDWFRGVDGAFDAALAGVRACKALGVKVGLRFTLTEDNAYMLSQMLDLCDAEGVDKFYLSHLVYAGRGDKNRGEDAAHVRTRTAMDHLIDRAWVAVAEGEPLEIVTGNDDADAVWFLRWAERNFEPEKVAHVRAHLEAWGGNSSGLGVANID